MVDRIPGPAPTRPHGTRAAIRRHERARARQRRQGVPDDELEPLCEACRVERNRLAKEQYQRRRRAT